jgi:proteasome lid subunit RPN8/RPN11
VSTRRFVLPRAVREAIVDHARHDQPLECCGLLLGRGTQILAAVPMRNLLASATRFRIDDQFHIALRRAIRGAVPPVELMGAYHSHPAGPARPSPTDVAEAHYAEWVHIIVGLAGGRARLRGFSLMADRSRMRPVRLGPDDSGTISG